MGQGELRELTCGRLIRTDLTNFTVICGALKRYELIQLPAIYYDRTLPVSFRLGYFIGVPVTAVLIVLAACLYPSRRASSLNPLDGIRFG